MTRIRYALQREPSADSPRDAAMTASADSFASRACRACAFFQRFHRREIRAGAITHSRNAMFCLHLQRRSAVSDHDVDGELRQLREARDQFGIDETGDEDSVRTRF